MKKIISYVLLVFVGLTSCAPPASNISPASNITKSTLAENTAAPVFTVGPAPLPLPTPILAPHASVDDFPLVANTIVEKQYYLPGQPVKISVFITNVGSYNVTFPNFPPKISTIADENGKEVVLARAGTDSLQVPPAFRVTFEIVWDQRGEDGMQVPPGWYQIGMSNPYYLHDNPPRGTTGGLGGQRIDIQPAYSQGVMIKDINPNLSHVVNGNNVTLDQVSLTQNGSSFTFFCIPDDYSYAAKITSVDAVAEYTINGSTRSAGTAGYGDDTSRGIKLVWGGNYPLSIVPKDVNEITFTISSISVKTVGNPPFSLGGPWVFIIPLQ